MRALFGLCVAFCLSVFAVGAEKNGLDFELKSSIQNALQVKTGDMRRSETQLSNFENDLHKLISLFLLKEKGKRDENALYMVEKDAPHGFTERDLHFLLVVFTLLKEKEAYHRSSGSIVTPEPPKPEPPKYFTEEDKDILLLLLAHRLKGEIEAKKKVSFKDMTEKITDEHLTKLLLAHKLKSEIEAEKKVTYEDMKEKITEEDLKKVLELIALKEKLKAAPANKVTEMTKEISEEDFKIVLVLLGLKKEIQEEKMAALKENMEGISDEDLKMLLLLIAFEKDEEMNKLYKEKESYVSDEDLKLLLLLVGLKEKAHEEAAKKLIIKAMVYETKQELKEQKLRTLLFKFFFLAGLRFNLEFIERYNVTLPPTLNETSGSGSLYYPSINELDSALSDADKEEELFKVFFISGLKYNLELLNYLNVTYPLSEEEEQRIIEIGNSGSVNLQSSLDSSAPLHGTFYARVTAFLAFICFINA